MNATALATVEAEDIEATSSVSEIQSAFESYADPTNTEEQRVVISAQIARLIAVALLKYSQAPEKYNLEPGFFPVLNNADRISVVTVDLNQRGIRFTAIIGGYMRLGYVHAEENFAIQIG